MKAVRIHSTGGPDVLKYEDVALPTVKKGELLIKNEAIGINFVDTYHRSGLYKLPLPTILGREGAGVVREIGEGVNGFNVGDKVAYFASGSYAEYTTVVSTSAYKLPEGATTKDGAALLLQGLTAHFLLRSTFPVNAKHTVLIHAGAGGLGQILIQVAKHLGAKVITTVSTLEKAEIVKKLGADHVILYTTEDVKTQARSFTNGRGVDVVYDSVGKTTFHGSIDSLAPLGYLVLCGNASGPAPSFDPLLLSEKGALFVTRPTLNYYVATPEIFEQRCVELFSWVKEGVIRLQPPQEFPLSEAPRAHELIESRKSTGKILLIP